MGAGACECGQRKLHRGESGGNCSSFTPGWEPVRTVDRMTPTLEIPESMLRDVHKLALDRGTTAQLLVEGALTRLLSEAAAQVAPVPHQSKILGSALTPAFQAPPETPNAAYVD